ncbi:MAG: hypothetical protein ACE5I7_14930 [Candidatus Binatia bacterium]
MIQSGEAEEVFSELARRLGRTLTEKMKSRATHGHQNALTV